MVEEQPGGPGGQEKPGTLYSLVVLGASAGGIEALSTVLSALPADFPAPLVVAQHLDRRRPSHLAEILGRRTPLLVHLVTEVAKLAPGTVYVVPSDRDIEIDDHEVRVRASLGTPSTPSVNRLFSSAARAYGERLIAVILSGTGSDGAEGAREVKAAGGTVVIEDPATAAFPGMPGALAPTTVDIVAHLDQIGPLLHDLLAGAYVPLPLDPDFPVAIEDDGLGAEVDLLGALLAQIRQHSGIDFSGYRRPTILRRLQRRMIATKSPHLDDYRRYLAHHPEEYQLLASSFLIKVTEFFRDTELFESLRDRVLPELITYARTQGNQWRIWSAGCATGEEAYSLAILVAETLGAELSQFTVRLFATDLDARAVAFARQGVYPAAALAGVPEDLRGRYFTQVDGAYEVKKAIRSLVTFGEHDLGQRPPFPQIDLVLCRNVLIYFTPEVQLRALSLFAFALRLDGYLALGKAESATLLSDYLAPVDSRLKLFRRTGSSLPPPVLPHVRDSFAQPRTMLTRTRRPAPVGIGPEPEEPEGTGAWPADGHLSALATDVPFGMVIVDRRYHILTINIAALRLLDIYRPAVGNDLVHLAEHIPATALRRIIDAIFQADHSVEGADADADRGRPPEVTEVVTLVTGLGERRDVEIAAYPYMLRPSSARSAPAAADRVETALLLVTDVTQAVQARIAVELAAARAQSAPDEAFQRQGEDIERLLARLEQMTVINRQLQTANQELGGANLELQRVNDELLLARELEQASTEEIRTLNEELQASNEELETVNEELEATVEELRLNNDTLVVRTEEVRELADTAAQQHRSSEAERAQLVAILTSLGDAVLVVDPSEVPLLTNEAYIRMFGDASAPFAALDTEGHPLPSEAMPLERAARGETFVMEFILGQDDGARRYFEASGQPIHSLGEALGGVISVRDITERSLHRLQDEFTALASHELRTPLTPLYSYLQLLEKLFAQDSEHAPSSRDESRVRDYITGALEQVRRLRRLVHDLLDVQRLQQGGFRLELGRVPLEQVVNRTAEVAQAMIKPGQSIEVEIAAPSLVVNADSIRLEQVLMNLLTNAITYAAQSPRIHVRLQRDGNEAVLQVIDQGPGIAEELLPHIFERFYQVVNRNERPSRRGLGLGLYIARALVVAHGGRLEVASVEAPSERHGTTFTIRLPLAEGGSNEE